VYNSAETRVGSSGGGTSAEEVNLLNPEPGNYTVYVHGFGVTGTANFTLFSWLLGSTSAGKHDGRRAKFGHNWWDRYDQPGVHRSGSDNQISRLGCLLGHCGVAQPDDRSRGHALTDWTTRGGRCGRPASPSLPYLFSDGRSEARSTSVPFI